MNAIPGKDHLYGYAISTGLPGTYLLTRIKDIFSHLILQSK